MPIQGQCGGRSTGPRLPRKAAMHGLCGSPGGRALLWGLMTRLRRTSVSTTLSRNGSRKGRAEPGMKASKKEEGHLVGRSAGPGDLQGPSTGGTAVTQEGVSCGPRPPAARAPPPAGTPVSSSLAPPGYVAKTAPLRDLSLSGPALLPCHAFSHFSQQAVLPAASTRAWPAQVLST